MTDTTFYTLSSVLDNWSREYAVDPNWVCIYDHDAGIDRRDEYMIDTSHFVNEDIRQMYVDKSTVAIAYPPEPAHLSEHELLKFLEEE